MENYIKTIINGIKTWVEGLVNPLKSQVSKAQSTATAAQSTATAAQNTANTAQNTATVAQDTATVAQDTATVAQDTATAAQYTATNTAAFFDVGAAFISTVNGNPVSDFGRKWNSGDYPGIAIAGSDGSTTREKMLFNRSPAIEFLHITKSASAKDYYDAANIWVENAFNDASSAASYDRARLRFDGKRRRSDGTYEGLDLYGLTGIILNSTTKNSTKKFMLTVDDSGELSITKTV